MGFEIEVFFGGGGGVEVGVRVGWGVGIGVWMGVGGLELGWGLDWGLGWALPPSHDLCIVGATIASSGR